MSQNLQDGVRLRPIDLAREHGLSTQAIRNYEEAGILPATGRTPHGYRTYGQSHARALRAFLALVPGHGHQSATSIMRAVNDGADAEAFRLIDESHAQLLDDRRTLQAVEDALRDLGSGRDIESGSNLSSSRNRGSGHDLGASRAKQVATPGDTFIGPLAASLRIRPATLRVWERAGLVRPRRDPQTGYRVYNSDDVRDAKLTHQLRWGGYLLVQIAPLIAQVRAAGGLEPLEAMLDDWNGRLAARGRAMLAGAAALEVYLQRSGQDSGSSSRTAGQRRTTSGASVSLEASGPAAGRASAL